MNDGYSRFGFRLWIIARGRVWNRPTCEAGGADWPSVRVEMIDAQPVSSPDLSAVDQSGSWTPVAAASPSDSPPGLRSSFKTTIKSVIRHLNGEKQ